MIVFTISCQIEKIGICMLHVKCQILTYFCDVFSLIAQVFIVLFDRVSLAEFLRYNGPLLNQCTLAVTLNFDL